MKLEGHLREKGSVRAYVQKGDWRSGAKAMNTERAEVSFAGRALPSGTWERESRENFKGI